MSGSYPCARIRNTHISLSSTCCWSVVRVETILSRVKFSRELTWSGVTVVSSWIALYPILSFIEIASLEFQAFWMIHFENFVSFTWFYVALTFWRRSIHKATFGEAVVMGKRLFYDCNCSFCYLTKQTFERCLFQRSDHWLKLTAPKWTFYPLSELRRFYGNKLCNCKCYLLF